MNHGYPADWPEVDAPTFVELLKEFDYRRDAWSDVIVYLEHPTKRIFAYEVGSGKSRRYVVHPSLAE